MSFREIISHSVTYMTAPGIQATHAFTTRHGGVSSGIYSTLNLAQKAGDEIENVKENYALICRAMGLDTRAIVCSNQVHGTHIRVATIEDTGKLFKPNPHEADGLITDSPCVALMVFTADCVPILLHDPIRKVIGAVHAGWRGTASNIAGEAIRKMETVFECKCSDIRAAIGPCISKCCYETDSDVASALPDFSSKYGEKFMVDLKDANRRLLDKSGVKNIEVSEECTSCKSDKYWSHRKTKGKRGTQAAIIVL
ncbi:MAG: peptidoglycan editing factor PgeF [Oscillospiraceae bacterium]|nr:peptidoglycan editing factor PgeF [Oscillospiraceae bacterium]MCL2277859.1 peptidoglycan editing factor PgeF [Oscillospiraceae bacterium]